MDTFNFNVRYLLNWERYQNFICGIKSCAIDDPPDTTSEAIISDDVGEVGF